MLKPKFVRPFLIISVIFIFLFWINKYFSEKCNEGKEFTVFPDEIKGLHGETKIGNTGLAFDSKKKLLVHARYNYTHSDVLYYSDYDGNFVGQLDVTNLIDHIQGLTYDWDSDTFWIWGTTHGIEHKPWTDGISLIQVTRKGVKLSEHIFANELNYPGMLSYAGDHKLWLKPNTKTTAYLYDLKDYKLLRVLDTKIGGEGIAFDKVTGNIWVHDGRNIVEIDVSTSNHLRSFPSPVKLGESEDVVIDEYGRVWISSDEGLKGIANGNKVWATNCSVNDSIYNFSMFFSWFKRWLSTSLSFI